MLVSWSANPIGVERLRFAALWVNELISKEVVKVVVILLQLIAIPAIPLGLALETRSGARVGLVVDFH
jgi:hypothetical protein